MTFDEMAQDVKVVLGAELTHRGEACYIDGVFVGDLDDVWYEVWSGLFERKCKNA